MEYKLLKKLEENGFKFEYEGMMVPTLEYLIESCGDEFCLFKTKKEWIAAEANPSLVEFENWNWVRAVGKTPSEAVAELWLKLHDNHCKHPLHNNSNSSCNSDTRRLKNK